MDDHFDGSRFFNPWNPRKHSFLNLLKWKLTAKPKPWPEHVENRLFPPPPNIVYGDQLVATFIGHATVLIQTQGINILADPIWNEFAAPFKMKTVRRRAAPGVKLEDLPKIDLILVSHGHYDHLDQMTLETLWNRDHPLIVAPLGNDAVIRSNDPSIRVQTLDWNQSLMADPNLIVHLMPAQHWSSRSFFDWDRELWGSFVLETPDGNIYFAGDTGYGNGEVFKYVKSRFQEFRFAMLPIGTYEPRWFMRYVHMNPFDAVEAFKELGEPYTMGIHFGTFKLSDEGFQDPIDDLKEALKSAPHPERFRALQNGESWLIP